MDQRHWRLDEKNGVWTTSTRALPPYTCPKCSKPIIIWYSNMVLQHSCGAKILIRSFEKVLIGNCRLAAMNKFTSRKSYQ